MDLATQIEECRNTFPEVVRELERLERWVRICIGSDIADIGGREVD